MVPFLLATSYYLARSSPRLDAMLRHAAFFGPILTEWEVHHGLSHSSKGMLIGLTVAILVVTVVLTSLSPVLLVVILLLMTASLFGVIRMPALPEEARAEIRLEQPGPRVLAAPAEGGLCSRPWNGIHSGSSCFIGWPMPTDPSR
jgi:uncharacterized membrane protein YbaN (DUF454 family)